MTFQNQHSFIKALIWIALLCKNLLASSNSCQVYPSEYAYLDRDVINSERDDANCMRYPPMPLLASIHSEDYTHCDGKQLRLTDSDLGSELYSSNDYYVWNARTSSSQLLFIFPTRVNLTTITLHYYSDTIRGRPRLRFFAVPDDFNVWDAPSASYSKVDVDKISPGREPTGPRNVTINYNFNTNKVAMVVSNNFTFAVSEVEFSTCSIETNAYITTTTSATTSINLNDISTTLDSMYQNSTNVAMVTVPATSDTRGNMEIFLNSTTNNQQVPTNLKLDIVLPVVIVVAFVVTIIVVAIVTLLLFLHYQRNRKNRKNHYELDTIYSTLDRGTQLQMQPQSTDACTELYDQIQLSPSTGQTEPNFNKETKLVNSYTSSTAITLEYHNTQLHESDTEKSSSAYATYAEIDKKKKRKSKPEEPIQSRDDKLEGNGYELKNSVSIKVVDPEKSKGLESERKDTLEQMYAVVQKKPKKHGQQEEITPPVPLHTMESLYTAVQKKPKQI